MTENLLKKRLLKLIAGLIKWIQLITAMMALHNFIHNSHWQSDDDGQGEKADGDGDGDGDEEEETDSDDDDDGGGHIVYQLTREEAMEVLCNIITHEYGRGRLSY